MVTHRVVTQLRKLGITHAPSQWVVTPTRYQNFRGNTRIWTDKRFSETVFLRGGSGILKVSLLKLSSGFIGLFVMRCNLRRKIIMLLPNVIDTFQGIFG